MRIIPLELIIRDVVSGYIDDAEEGVAGYFTYNGIVLARLHKKQIKILATRLFVKPNGRLSFF